MGQGTVLCPADNNDNQMTANEINYNDGNFVRQKNHQYNDNGQPLGY